MPGKFELYKDKTDKYRFRLKAGNGEVVGQSQGYTTKEGALNGIKSVSTNGSEEGQYTFKEGKDGKTYFSLNAKNHQVILTSQGYSSESGAKSGMKSIIKNAPGAILKEL